MARRRRSFGQRKQENKNKNFVGRQEQLQLFQQNIKLNLTILNLSISLTSTDKEE